MCRIPIIAARSARLALLISAIATATACGDAAAPTGTNPVRTASQPDASTGRMSDSAMAVARSGGATLAGTDYNFYDVKVVPEGMAVTVFFKYTGNMTPILTVGSEPNVYAYIEGWAAGKSLGDGKWQARVPGLDPNKLYYFVLENLGGGKYGSQFKTLKRQVVVDVDWVQVDFDGDPGFPCGEIRVRTRVQADLWTAGYKYDSYTNEYGICSGYGQGFIGSDGKWTYTDWQDDFLYVTFTAMDRDACWAFHPMCGDFGSSSGDGFDVRPYGNQTFTIKTIGNVNATITGKVTVNYVP